MKLTTLIPTALLALASGIALAQDDDRAKAVDYDEDSAAAADYDDERTADYDAAASEAGTHPDFAQADTDKDGLLSIAELQAAMPDLEITDENADGFVNQSEAESAIAGLAFESNGYTGGSSLVSEPEYGLIVSQLGEGESGDAADDARSPGGALDSGETSTRADSADDVQN